MTEREWIKARGELITGQIRGWIKRAEAGHFGRDDQGRPLKPRIPWAQYDAELADTRTPSNRRERGGVEPWTRHTIQSTKERSTR